MNQISKCFIKLKKQHKTALMPFITMGYPHSNSIMELVPNMIEAGADMIEMGIPFSDPIADGPVIQNSSRIAIQNGMHLNLGLSQIEELRKEGIKIPLILMCYYNTIFQFGLDNFATRLADLEVSAVIVPDLPPDESLPLRSILQKFNIDMIYLLSPNSTEKRIKLVTSLAAGFIYIVSTLGVTGIRDEISGDLQSLIQKVRRYTNLPLAVGFGISTPKQASEIAEFADGIIIGSAFIKAISTQDIHDLSYKGLLQSINEKLINKHHIYSN